MADGLIIRHPQTGAVIFDASTITSHSRVSFTTNGAAGSTNVPTLARGTPFVLQALPTNDNVDYGFTDFTISGTTVSWQAAQMPMRVLVGSRAEGVGGGAETFDGLVIRRPPGNVVQVSCVDRAMLLSNYGATILAHGPPYTTPPMVRASITVTDAVSPVLAIRPVVGRYVTVRKVEVSGTTYTFHLACQSEVSVPLQWWVFDVAGAAIKVNTDVALILRNPADGTTTYDSRSYPFNVVNAITGGGISSPTGGQVLAAVQATYAWRQQQTIDPEITDPPPGYPNYVYVRSSSSQAALAVQGDGSIACGISQYDYSANWMNPTDAQNRMIDYGTPRHVIIDVSRLPSTPMPSANDLAVAVDAPIREITVSSATPVGTVTPPVTASATGGIPPYNYLWLYNDGSTGVGSYGPENAAAFQTQTANQTPGTTATARWICRVVDAGGRVGWSQPVTFIHKVNRISITPDPFSFGNATFSTDDPSGFVGVDSRKITGITQPIVLRVERFSYVGDLSTFTLLVYKGPSATGPWTSVGTLNATGAATRYIDFTISDGEWFYYYAYGETTSGRRSGRFDVQIWNETAGHIGLTSGRLALTVDADNNYNVADYTPDPFSFGNASEVTNDSSGFVGVGSRQITGINRTVTLRVERFSYSGNLTTANTYVYRGPGPSGPWTKVADIDSRGSATRYVDFTVNNGDWIYYYAYGDTSSGRRSGSWDIAFWNESTGHTHFTGGKLSLTVDNDNNYNVPVYNLNPMDFRNIWFDTADNGYYTYNNYQNVSGNNQPVTIAVQMANFSVSGPIRDSIMACQAQGRGDIMMTNLYNGTNYMTVYNGDTIRFAVVVNSTGGRRSFGFDVYLYNQNTGEFIDHFNVSGYFGA